MSTDKTPLGDRMKLYEMAEAGRKLMPGLPIMIRLDGKAFHTFTKGLKRPYDERLSNLMVETTAFLVSEYNAVLGYTQSDEITLVLWSEDYNYEMPYDRRIQKLVSDTAAAATGFFNRMMAKYLPEKVSDKADKFPRFDSRVWNVPSLEEATNCLLWRELDATKNAVAMAAQSMFSHKELQGLNGAQMQEKMFQERGVNFNNYPSFFKRGSYVRRAVVRTPFTAEELEALPPKHAARSNPGLIVERSQILRTELPPLNRIPNRMGVLFRGECLVTEEGPHDYHEE